jgi:hypothetical protein
MFAPQIQKPEPKAVVKAAARARAPVRPARPLNGWDSKARSPQQIGSLMRGVIQRKCASGAGASGGTCASCEDKESGRLQRNLTIGSSNDPLEHEADRVADQVLAGPSRSDLSRVPISIQRHTSAGTQQYQEAPPSVGRTLATPGRPLDAPIRRDMETRFGHDFSQVRVHDGPEAGQSARDVGAQAYTVGRNIVFGAGLFAPATTAGRRLLAHELTHTIQQVATAGAPLRRAPANRLDGQSDDRPGATLPHTEATGLVECMRIMGADSADYCRSEVLGEKPAPKCAATHTIADDVHAAINVAWGKSGHGEAKRTEHGGRIVTDKADKRQIRTGEGVGGTITLPDEKKGDTTIGTYHTHPYTKAQGAPLGVAFSGEDIENFVGGSQGGVKYIGAGSCYFVLDTLSLVERDGCKKSKLTQKWKLSYGKAGGTFQEKVETAVKDTIVGCGMCFYKACRPDAASPVPKIAKLA